MQYFGDDIAAQLRLVRKKRWSTQEEKRIAEEIELQVSRAEAWRLRRANSRCG